MTLPVILLWASVVFVIYTYAIYPLVLAIVARLREKPLRRAERGPRSVSVILAAYNEEASIGRRLSEFADMLADPDLKGEVIVVSDGSTDRTAETARSWNRAPVRVIELPVNLGKAVALNTGCLAARHEIMVFADARQSWAPDALNLLLENFSGASVGAATGELILESAAGVMAGVGQGFQGAPIDAITAYCTGQ